jgi:hypothetical protein
VRMTQCACVLERVPHDTLVAIRTPWSDSGLLWDARSNIASAPTSHLEW